MTEESPGESSMSASQSRSGSRSRSRSPPSPRSRSQSLTLSSLSSDSSSSAYGLEENEVDQLLENAVQEGATSAPTNGNQPEPPIEKTKIVLKKRGQDYFEPLPEGWIEVNHASGIPLYLHKQSRVCTTSKPYYLGSGSVRRHELPVGSIPCLQYRRELLKDCQAGDKEADTVGLETVQDHKREKWLSADDVRAYCENLFEFSEIKIRKFKTWADRRKHNSVIREQRQRPSLPDDTRLITCPSSGNNDSKKAFVMNPANKSSVCILHEFVQHKFKVQPRYIYKELENAVTPYSATAEINARSYGIGYGKSKKDAKEEAAKKTIEILIPQMKDVAEFNSTKSSQNDSSQNLRFFDDIKIDDIRVTDLCAKAGLQSPYQILVECLKRNSATCSTDITHNVQLIKHHKNIYTMNVGEHEAKVDCKNKREGKQRAAQVILQRLHPQVTSWGGLLLMYGRGSCKTPREKKEEEQKITELQSTASPNTPNYAILNKLREEMQKKPKPLVTE